MVYLMYTNQNYLLDFPDNSFNGLSATIYFPFCNMKCKWCNLCKMLDTKNLKTFSICKLLEFIDENENFIDLIVISGGEPTLDPNFNDLVEHFYEMGIKVILYTNLSINIDKIIDLVDSVYVDYKGNTIQEIIDNTGVKTNVARNTLNNYDKYKYHEKVIFRVNENINPPIAKEIIRYTAVNL